MNRLLGIAGCTLLALPVLVSAETTIEQIAPENSILVVNVKNAAESMERLERTSLWVLWQSDELAEYRREMIDEFNEDMGEMLDELDLDEDALAPPTGALGFAVFPRINEETQLWQTGMLLLADYGENAEKTQELLDAAMAKGDEDGSLEIDETDVLGRTVYTLTIIEEEDAEEEGDDFGDMSPFPLPSPEDIFGDMHTVHLVREGNTFMLSSSFDGLRDALETLDEGGDTGLAEREDYRALTGKLGDDMDAFAVLLTRDLSRILGGAEGMDMMMMMFAPLIETVFGDIQGAGGSLRIDGETAMVEESFAIYMPSGKTGIPALFEKQTTRGIPPGFVGPDTLSYMSMNFETHELTDFVRDIVQSTPMLQMQLGEQLPQIIAMVDQICSALGTEVHQVMTVQRPITAESMPKVLAIRCTEPETLESALAGLAPQMGLEPRDFLGHRIFSPSDGAMGAMMGEAPPSLGIGGGFLMMGPASAVEQTLRSVSQEAGSLQDQPEFQRAAQALPSQPVVLWGYSDFVETMQVQFQVQELINAEMLAEMREQFPEFAEELEAEQGDMPDFLADFDYEMLRRHMGPMVWYMQSVDDGFVGKAYMLGPGE